YCMDYTKQTAIRRLVKEIEQLAAKVFIDLRILEASGKIKFFYLAFLAIMASATWLGTSA
ncbi:MAG: hypothetical protein AAB834_04305, partial [Patescibacteria group bacterium]